MALHGAQSTWPLWMGADLRYARQIAVPGVGREGQARLQSGHAAVLGDGLDAEVCAAYVIGAGVGHVRVARAIADALENADVRVELHEEGGALEVEVAGERRAFTYIDDEVERGARAARWVLARLLSPRAAV